MKKAIFFLFFICLLMTGAFADYQVDQATVNAEVSTNGRTQVTATYQLTFDGAQDQLTVPLPDGNISRVSAETYRYQVDKTDSGVNVVLSGSFAGTQTVTVSYTVSDTYTTDSDGEGEVYQLGLLSSRWARAVGSCSFQVILPQPSGTMPEDYTLTPAVLSGYYGELAQSETGVNLNGTIVTGTVENRMAYDSLTAQVTVPVGYFYVRTSAIAMIHVTYLAIGMLGVLFLLMIFWRLRLRTPRQNPQPRLLTPGGLLPCQLPQILDGGTCDIAVLILEWANLGYLTIQRSKKGYVVLTRAIPMGTERSKAERKLFQRIFSTGYRVAATPGRFAAAGARFRTASRRSLNHVIFDPKGGNVVLVQIPCRILLAVGVGYLAQQMLPEGGGFVVLAVLAGMVGFLYSIYLHTALSQRVALKRSSQTYRITMVIALALLAVGFLGGAFLEMLIGLFACCFSAIATSVGPRRSQRGQDLLSQAKGCRMFYCRVTWQRLQILTGRNSRFFQSQLPKAAALGVDKPFAKRFERLPVPRPEWLGGRGPASTTASDLQRETALILKSLRESFHS